MSRFVKLNGRNILINLDHVISITVDPQFCSFLNYNKSDGHTITEKFKSPKEAEKAFEDYNKRLCT